jgi:cell division transport system permease protein
MPVSKRNKPSYAYAIIGVSLVLFLLGIIGWLVLNGRAFTRNLAESIVITADFHDNTRPENIAKFKAVLDRQPFTKATRVISKEEAMQTASEIEGIDVASITDGNPLFPSIDLNVWYDYVNRDSLEKIKTFLEQSNIVAIAHYEKRQVSRVTENLRKINLVLAGIALLLVIAVVFLIDNTVRLAMFSNRFLIKTMQMVGATQRFITKPFDRRAIINGIISGVLAIAGLLLLIYFAERNIPELKDLHNMPMLLLLMGAILLLGVLISLLSTHRSVVKYLKMHLDDLY